MPRPAGESIEVDKGLKQNAVGMLSSIVIGIASTAPAYSLAVTLGLVTAVAGMGLKSPAIMIVSFIPMILIASSYYYLNKADPDCGTTFSWVTRAMGPRTGWVTGWVMVAADVIVMASLAQITGVSHLDIGAKLMQADGTIAREVMGDFCHPTNKGYQIWADALAPIIQSEMNSPR